MYANDLLLYVRGRVILDARDQLSEALGMVIPWIRSLVFEISIAKCQFSVFTRSRGDLSDLVLAIRAISVIRVLARVSWGVTPSLLLVAYRNMVRSTLEWGSPLFSSAPRGTLRLLYRAQYMAYRSLRGLLGTTARSVRPGYFDWPWRSVAVSIPVDPVSGHDFRSSDDSDRVCKGFLAQHYPGYDVIFTDGAVDPASGRVGCGFYVVGVNFRYGLSLQPFTSVLSAELYAILRAVHYAGQSAMSRVMILSESMRSLTLLGDCMAVSVKNYLVFKIAHIVVGLSDLGRFVRFMWVPGHVGIVGNKVADGVARAAGGLPYCIQYGLPYCDLLDPIGRDFEAWVGLLWPYVGTRGASCTRNFSRVTYKSDRPWFSRLSLPRRSICLVTRLRIGHVCTGDHFLRMGWDLEVGCSCGAPLRDLFHVLHDCPQLEEFRPGYYAFLSGCFPDRRPEGISIEDLVFDPGPGVVGALAGHQGRCDRVL